MLAGVHQLQTSHVVNVWLLLHAPLTLCLQRRQDRQYEGTPEVEGYFEHHACPASEVMKWNLVHTRLRQQDTAPSSVSQHVILTSAPSEIHSTKFVDRLFTMLLSLHSQLP